MLYNVAIIGGGPAGYTAAERAASRGLSVILFEKNALGGVCLNEGCIPTKTLLYSANFFNKINDSSKYGIDLPLNDVSFDLAKVISRKNKVVRKLTAGVRMRLSSHNVTIVSGEAFVDNISNDKISIKCDDESYQAAKLILCNGSETVIPPIEGLQSVDYWTSREALNIKQAPESLIIIGGGVIGVEFASFYNSIGTKVTVIEMMPEILGNMDTELSAMLRAEYIKKGVNFRLNTKVLKFEHQKVIVECDGEVESLDFDKVLVSVGRKAKLENIGLFNLNLETVEKRGLRVNRFMQTSESNVYACGDIIGFSLLAHTAVREAEVAINHILGIEDEMSYKTIPSVVYTYPEVAGIGMTEEMITHSEAKYNVHKLPMTFSGRFVAENELANGICKIITDEHDILVGCHLLGNPASELIVIAGIGIEKKYTIEEFRKIIFPHPTVGEIFHECLFT